MKKSAIRYAPMRVQARPGSAVEKQYYLKSGLPSGWSVPTAIAPGIDPSPFDDLIYHGGKVVSQMEFQNVYLSGARPWRERDVSSIDRAIRLAMQAPRLNNVIAQYFPGASLSCDVRESLLWEGPAPTRLDEPDVQKTVIRLYDEGKILKSDLGSCIFNLILPPGSELRLGSSSSFRGLGGYHGSVHISRAGKKITLYYSANVFSEIQASGRENGIAVFDRPWKNVVATLYHELNEFRTDADVNDAIQNDEDGFLGWNSRRGSEIGDQPIFASGANLNLVFKEVSGRVGGPRLPIQLMYSNAAHGAEGPIATPYAPAITAVKKKSKPKRAARAA